MKRTYDTSLMISIATGALPADRYRDIPRSTIHGWKTRTHNHIYGFEDMACFAQMVSTAYENKRLRSLKLSLTKLFIIYRGIVNNLNDKNQRLFAVKDKILASAHTWAKTLPQSLIVRLLDISVQQYAAWKKGFYCKYSPVRFCRKIVPTQLTFEETYNIARFVSNPKFFGWSLASVYHVMMRETHRYFLY